MFREFETLGPNTSDQDYLDILVRARERIDRQILFVQERV